MYGTHVECGVLFCGERLGGLRAPRLTPYRLELHAFTQAMPEQATPSTTQPSHPVQGDEALQTGPSKFGALHEGRRYRPWPPGVVPLQGLLLSYRAGYLLPSAVEIREG